MNVSRETSAQDRDGRLPKTHFALRPNRAWVLLSRPPDPFDPEAFLSKAVQPRNGLAAACGALKAAP